MRTRIFNNQPMLSLIFIIRIALNTLIFVARNTSVFPKYYKNIYFSFPYVIMHPFSHVWKYHVWILSFIFTTRIALTTIIFVIKLWKNTSVFTKYYLVNKWEPFWIIFLSLCHAPFFSQMKIPCVCEYLVSLTFFRFLYN